MSTICWVLKTFLVLRPLLSLSTGVTEVDGGPMKATVAAGVVLAAAVDAGWVVAMAVAWEAAGAVGVGGTAATAA